MQFNEQNSQSNIIYGRNPVLEAVRSGREIVCVPVKYWEMVSSF